MNQEKAFVMARGHVDIPFSGARTDPAGLLSEWRTYRQRDIADWREELTTQDYDDGLQLTPGRGGRLRGGLVHQIIKQRRAGTFQNRYEGRPLVGSLHQTFAKSAGELARYMFSARPSAATIQNLGFTAFMEDPLGSIEQLSQLQSAAGSGELSTVVYPAVKIRRNSDGYATHNNTPMRPRLFQPESRLWDESVWNIKRWLPVSEQVDAMRRQMPGRGLDGVALDLVHQRLAYNGEVLPNWEDFIPEIAKHGLIREIHVGANRTDVAKNNDPLAQPTVSEYQALTSTSSEKLPKTELGQMLWLAVREADQYSLEGDKPLRIVIEIKPSPDGPPEHEAHALAVANVRALARQALGIIG